MNLKLKSLGVALLYCALFKLSFGLGALYINVIPANAYWYALGATGTISILIITAIFLKFEKKSFKDYGLNWEVKTPTRFIGGTLIGIGISCLMLLSIIFFADLKVSFSDNINISSFLFWTLPFIPLAFMEEVAFRSYPFIKLQRVFGLRFAQVFLAILFALYHVGEDPFPGVFIGPGVWAFVYGMAAVYSKGIALPTGLHFGANFILATIGDKRGVDPIFIIEYINDATPEMIAHTGNIGVAFQIALFVFAIFVMEKYIRKNKSSGLSKS